jgi:hypothetical protein
MATEEKYWIKKGLEKYSGSTYEKVPLSKILLDSKISPVGLVKIETNYPPRVEKNRYEEYKVIDGRHRIFNFYLYNFDAPHNLKVGCLVVQDPTEKHYSGFNIWDASEDLEVQSRRSALCKFLNVFGLFRKPSEFFILSKENHTILSRKTKALLESTEDQLDSLYKDFIARTNKFISLIKSDRYAGKQVKSIQKEFAEYQVMLESLVHNEEKGESILEKLILAIKEEMKKPSLKNNKQLSDILANLEGDKENSGLIVILGKQLKVIKTGKMPKDASKFERELLSEVEMSKNLIESKRSRLYDQIRKTLDIR